MPFCKVVKNLVPGFSANGVKLLYGKVILPKHHAEVRMQCSRAVTQPADSLGVDTESPANPFLGRIETICSIKRVQCVNSTGEPFGLLLNLRRGERVCAR